MKTSAGWPTLNDVREWLQAAERGDRMVYHVGHLAFDRSQIAGTVSQDIAIRELNLAAAELLRAAGATLPVVAAKDSRAKLTSAPASVALVQRRVGAAFQYIAIKL